MRSRTKYCQGVSFFSCDAVDDLLVSCKQESHFGRYQGRSQESQKFCDRGADPYFWSKFSNSWVKKRFLPRQEGMPPLPPPPPGYAPGRYSLGYKMYTFMRFSSTTSTRNPIFAES